MLELYVRGEHDVRHKFEFLFSLFDQGLIFSVEIVFNLIFSQDLGYNELRVSEYFHLLGSQVFG